jgi:hypothetical protein
MMACIRLHKPLGSVQSLMLSGTITRLVKPRRDTAARGPWCIQVRSVVLLELFEVAGLCALCLSVAKGAVLDAVVARWLAV